MFDSNPGASLRAKTIQQYIDECPVWRDGTPVASIPLTAMQWRVWALATAGKFFEGLVVFMTGVALPLIVREFGLSDVAKGAVGAATLFGILVGASVLGGLSDVYGRKRMFILEMILFAACLVCLVFSPSFIWLLACLFGMGLALGCDYPTAHMVISESIPSTVRGKLVLSAFAFQAVGALAGTAVGYLILKDNPDLGAWRMMYATAIVPAILVIIGRFFIPDSGNWLASRGRLHEARLALQRLLRREPPYPTTIALARPGTEDASGNDACSGYKALFRRRNLRATILAALPWFLQDLGTYGIGMFTPTILASVLGAQRATAHSIVDLVHNDMAAAKGAAFIDVLLLVGIVLAVLLVDRVGRIRLQVTGFLGCAAGLLLAGMSLQAPGGAGGGHQTVLLFAGFMLFSLMTNLGPNATTYLIAGEVFPTRMRGKGAGFAASFAKLGAVSTAFLFPILLKDIGAHLMLYALVGTSLLGAGLTWAFRIETRGRDLDEIGQDSDADC